MIFVFDPADLILLVLAWTHVALAPYTKVEESFSLHATHDVLMYGLVPENLHSYDHFVFPGAVPRSFIGSVLLGWLSTPIIHLASYLGYVSGKRDLLLIVRLVLATLNASGLCLLRRSISRRFGFLTSLFFTILTSTQFHLPFWMGRTLPNMFALFPVNLAFYSLLNRQPNTLRPSQKSVLLAIALLTFTFVVLRVEVSLLLGPLILQALWLKWVSFSSAFKVGATSALLSIALTVSIDSYFWDKWPLWPELYSLYFNVYQGKSAEWGTSPFHAYFTTHLPKLLLASLPLSALGFLTEPRVRPLLVLAFAFLALLSGLGHKEWRFAVYVVPLFNIAAARGAAWMAKRPISNVFGRLCVLALIAMIAASAAMTLLLTDISRMNYPGGEALARLNELYSDRQHVHVHIDNTAAQSGASLFLQTHATPFPSYIAPPHTSSWIYNKTEHLSPSQIAHTPHFTHALTEAPDAFPPRDWIRAEGIKAFDGFSRTGLSIGRLKERGLSALWDVDLGERFVEKVWIMERRL